jgi:hypothetical protein
MATISRAAVSSFETKQLSTLHVNVNIMIIERMSQTINIYNYIYIY